MKKLTLWNDPIGHIKFFFQIHTACVRVCGNWFGVKLHTNGTVEFVNDDFYEFVMGCIKQVNGGE